MKIGTSIPGAHPEPLNTSDSPGTRALLLSTRRDSGPDDTVDVDVDADVDGRTVTGVEPKGFAGDTGATVDGPVMTGVGPKGLPRARRQRRRGQQHDGHPGQCCGEQERFHVVGHSLGSLRRSPGQTVAVTGCRHTMVAAAPER